MLPSSFLLKFAGFNVWQLGDATRDDILRDLSLKACASTPCISVLHRLKTCFDSICIPLSRGMNMFKLVSTKKPRTTSLVLKRRYRNWCILSFASVLKQDGPVRFQQVLKNIQRYMCAQFKKQPLLGEAERRIPKKTFRKAPNGVFCVSSSSGRVVSNTSPVPKSALHLHLQIQELITSCINHNNHNTFNRMAKPRKHPAMPRR